MPNKATRYIALITILGFHIPCTGLYDIVEGPPLRFTTC